MKKKSLLVTLANKNYLEKAKQVFAGAYFNAGWKGDFMLLAHDIPEKDLKWFRKKGVLVKHCKPLFNKKMMGMAPTIYSSKFYLFKEEFKRWNYIVYLDTDTLIRGPLNYLLKNKIRGFAAVKSAYSARLASELRDRRDFKKYRLHKPSFSAGFFVFNTDIINPKTFLRLKYLYYRYQETATTGDQAIFNLFFYNIWQELPLVFNVCTTEFNQWRIHPKNLDGLVMHITSYKGKKPWEKESYFYQEWVENFKKADLINLKNKPYVKEWTNQKIVSYSEMLSKDADQWGAINHALWRLEQFYYWIVLQFENRYPRTFLLFKKIKKAIYV